jgi:uncharacterized protein (DUF302 family)
MMAGTHGRRSGIAGGSNWSAAAMFAVAVAGVVLAFHFTTAAAADVGIRTAHEEPFLMTSGEGVISVPSPYPVPETLDRVETALRAKGVKIFARIDHRAEAVSVGLDMPPTQLLLFGNPKGGTPAMLAVPTAAIDLPLKALAWQDHDGKVWLSYNDPAYLQRRFGLSDDVVKPLAAAVGLIAGAVR